MLRKLTLVPVVGKYVNVTLEGRSFEIWRLNPVTGKPGTDIDYGVALDILALQPPVASILPVIEKGQSIPQLSQADLEYIKAKRIPGSNPENNSEKVLTFELEEQKRQLAATQKALAETQELLKKLTAQKSEEKVTEKEASKK